MPTPGYSHKVWKDQPDHTTPISAAALEDLEDRVTQFAFDTASALSGSFKGVWNSGTAYSLGNGVSVGTVNYISTVAGVGTNTNHNPVGDDGSHWTPAIPSTVVSDTSGHGTFDFSITKEAPLNIAWAEYGAVCDGTTDDSAAVTAAHAAFPVNGGEMFVPGPTVWNNVSLNKPTKLRGVGQASRLIPGASGRIFTSDYQGTGAQNGQFHFEDLGIGELQGASSPSRAYSAPLIEFVNWSGFVGLNNVYARINNTGTLFRLSASSDIAVRDSHLFVGAYGLAFEVMNDTGGGFQADTIAFHNTMIEGVHFAIFRPESGTYTFFWENSKQYWSATYNVLDDKLSYTGGFGEVAAGATQIQVAAAGWTTNDLIYIEGDFATDSAIRSGKTAEINKVTAVSGAGPYVLTLAQPLQYAHGTNAGAFTVQVFRGGVPLSLSANLFVGGAKGLHFEQAGACIMDMGTRGARWQDCTYTADRFLRVCGNTQDFEIGATLCTGRSGNNYILDIPAFNSPNSNFDRFRLRGPWLTNVPSILEAGTSRAIGTDSPASVLQAKNYIVDDSTTNFQRRTFHTTNSAPGAVQMRGGGGNAVPNNWEIHSDGTYLYAGRTVIGGQDRIKDVRNGSINIVRESFDRTCGATGTSSGATGNASGTLIGAVIPVMFGDSFTRMTVWVRSAATLGSNADSHWYLALYDSSGNLIVQTADQTTTTLPASSGARTPINLQSTYTPATSTWVTAAIMVYVGTGGAPAISALGCSATVSGPLATGALHHGVYCSSGAGTGLTTGVAPGTFGTVSELVVSGGATGIIPYFALLA